MPRDATGSRLLCLRNETGSIPVRGATANAVFGLQSHGDRPSFQHSERGFDSFATCYGVLVQQENTALALQKSGCDSPALHPSYRLIYSMCFGVEAHPGERLGGIEKVAGANPVDSTASNADEDYIN